MNIHPVFHVKLLEMDRPNQIVGHYQEPPPPVEVDGKEHWEVESILDTKIDCCFTDSRCYLVKYTGYSNTQWLGSLDLKSCADLLADYNTKHNIQL